MILFLVVFLVESFLQIIVRLCRKHFKWLITSLDELPHIQQDLIDKYFSYSHHELLGWCRRPNSTGRDKTPYGFSNSEMAQRALFNQVLNEPKREFFGFNDRTEKIISKQFNRFVKQQFEKAI